MDAVPGARSFQASGETYDLFMGRYSRALAPGFADFAGVSPDWRALDVGCGPGALTTVLVERLGADAVAAVDPSPPFVEACRARHPGVDVRMAAAESLPWPDDVFDAALAQLVLHFTSEPLKAAREMRRVVRPGGVLSAAVWEFEQGMEMLRAFWDAALVVDPDAPDEARTLRFGRRGEVAALFESAGLHDVEETTLSVTSTYAGFDELWAGLLAGIGPAGAYCVGLPEERRQALRAALFERLDSPAGAVTLQAVAIAARGTVPR